MTSNGAAVTGDDTSREIGPTLVSPVPTGLADPRCVAELNVSEQTWEVLDGVGAQMQPATDRDGGTAHYQRSVNPNVPDDRAPLYVDIDAFLAGGLPDAPSPELLQRADGVYLFYPGQVNHLFGDPETGKTWIAMAAVAEALSTPRRCLVIDLDHNGVASTLARLIALGVPEEILRDPAQFRFAEPEDAAHLDQIVQDSRTWRPAVVVVDSMGELLPLLRLSSNSPDDFTAAHARGLKPLAKLGAAVIVLDHPAKNLDSRSQGASGTAAKRRAVGGTSLRVTLKEPFTPGRGGSCYLTINKDRHGGLRAHCPTDSREPAAGVFELTDHDGTLAWTVHPPRDGASNEASDVPDADLAALDKLVPPPSSQRDVQRRLGWGGDRAMAALQASRRKSRSRGAGSR